MECYLNPTYDNMIKNGFRVAVHPTDLFQKGKGSPLAWLNSCIERGFNVNSMNSKGLTFLLWFVEEYARTSMLPSVVELLCRNGASVNQLRPDNKENVLMTLISRGFATKQTPTSVAKTAAVLLQFGIDANHLDAHGRSALWYIAFYCSGNVDTLLPLIEALLEGGLRVKQRDQDFLCLLRNFLEPSNCAWPQKLHSEPSVGRITSKMIQLFLDNGLDVNSHNKNVSNILMFLASDFFQCVNVKNKLKLAELLIQRGIDVKKQDCRGNTVLVSLCKRKYCSLDKDFNQLATLFLDCGVDVKARNANGHSAMYVLIDTCRVVTHLRDAMSLLISRGADTFECADVIARYRKKALVKQAYCHAFAWHGYRGKPALELEREKLFKMVGSRLRENVCHLMLRRQLGIDIRKKPIKTRTRGLKRTRVENQKN